MREYSKCAIQQFVRCCIGTRNTQLKLPMSFALNNTKKQMIVEYLLALKINKNLGIPTGRAYVTRVWRQNYRTTTSFVNCKFYKP